jgi:hypothetical protein
LLKYRFRKGNAADFIATIDRDGDGKITFLELLKELFPMTPSKQLNDIYRKFYPEAIAKPIKCVFSLDAMHSNILMHASYSMQEALASH